MSEQKRVPFQTLGTTKKEKKGEESVPSYRFTLTLPESNEQACPEFNYRELLKSAEKKRKKENKKGDENTTTNGLDPHDDDDEDKLQEIAKRFEAKYGTATTAGRKKHNKYDDYVDLGAGYDESDSFIDNTDAYDEIVPEEWTTVRGGFYINSGPLEFKTSEGNSLLGNNNNNNNIEDETSESSEEETEDLPSSSPKQSKKRSISSSEDEEIEDVVSDNPSKKPKLDDNEREKNSNHDVAMKKKKKQQELSMLNSRTKNTVVRDLLKVKRELRETDVIPQQEDQQQQQQQQEENKKKGEKIDSNKPKAAAAAAATGVLEKKFDIKRFEKKVSTSNGLDINKKSEHKKTGFYDDTIESVVNAARVDDQSSSDTMDSGKSRSIVCSNSDCDDAMDKEESPLPEMLHDDVKDMINKLKLHAENTKEGKTKFFNSQINSSLFSLEKKLRVRYSASIRLSTYAHLAHFLPCSKATLLNRVKKLSLQDIERRVQNPLERLKAAIDKIMPSVMVKYTRDCQRVAEDKGVEGSPTDPDSSDGDDSGNKSSEKTRIPQRRFPWTDETKKLVYDIAAARREHFDILKPRKETVETFVSSFMDMQVRPLWPTGWVRLQTLLKYSNPQLQAKRKAKKHKDGSTATGISSGSIGSGVLGTMTTKCDFQTSNNSDIVNQERVKSPTNFTKSISLTGGENNTNFISTSNHQAHAVTATKSNDTNIQSDKKTTSSRSKDKNRESPVASQYNSSSTTISAASTIITNSSVAKISVVPTAQLMPSKSKSDKFNPMDLTSSSLSITPVNDYHKSSGKTTTEFIKDFKKETVDTVSITPCAESVAADGERTSATTTTATTVVTQSGNNNQSANIQKPIPLKHRILQESIMDVKTEQEDDNINKSTIGDKDSILDTHKTESSTHRKDKKEKRSGESRHKSSHDSKKRKREHRAQAQAQELSGQSVKVETVVPTITSTSTPAISKEEQEQRQIEETMAATNFLSQIINDDDAPRPMTEKRKETTTSVLDEATGNMIAPSEQENDVQMVMRSLKELQELQEMTCSPSHSPVSVIQKSSNNKPSATNMQYVSYQDDYQHLYHKKEDKIRTQKKEDTAQW